MSYGFVANMLFTCLRCYSEGMGLTLPVFWVAFIGMLLNIPLDIIFVYGYFGIPPMGGIGCGIATSINIVIGFICFDTRHSSKRRNKPTKIFLKFSGPNSETTKEAFKTWCANWVWSICRIKYVFWRCFNTWVTRINSY